MDFNKMAVEHYTNQSGVIFGSRDDHASLAALLQRVATTAAKESEDAVLARVYNYDPWIADQIREEHKFAEEITAQEQKK